CTVATLRKGVTLSTSASNTISRFRIVGSSPSGVVIAVPPPSLGLQALQDLHRVRGLRSPRVIGVGIHRADEARPIDHEAGRAGQAPGAIAIAARQVD